MNSYLAVKGASAMLDFLRKRKRSWIITFLLGVIIIVFVAFYGGSKYQDSRLQNIAEVNGEAISQPEFAEAYQRAVGPGQRTTRPHRARRRVPHRSRAGHQRAIRGVHRG